MTHSTRACRRGSARRLNAAYRFCCRCRAARPPVYRLARPPVYRRLFGPQVRPLLDFGMGVSLEVDRQKILPVARIKIKDLVSIKVRQAGRQAGRAGRSHGPACACRLHGSAPLWLGI